ncbi:MAG: HAD family hydrolase [Xanthobacteraceae bacterium]|nr:HAD family hydrolase [Xanthobacteraceae bacterium]
MTRISLVVSDVDGTLLTTDKRLTAASVAAVDELRRRGIAFSLTSSRPPFGMRALVDALKVDLPIGPFNGSSIVNPDFSVLEQSVVPARAARQSLALFARHGFDAWVFTATEWLVQNHDDRYVPREAAAIATAPRVVADFGNAIADAAKIVGVSGDFARLEAGESELRSELGDSAHAARSQHYYLDVTPPGRDKGTFVTALGRRLGIPSSAIATIGDMTNDVPMFAASGYSIAMGNASDAVKARAAHVTDANDADGFAKAIDRLLRDAA